MTDNEIAEKAAEKIATNIDNASQAMGGPRFLFQEMIAEQKAVILSAITEAKQESKKIELDQICADAGKQATEIIANTKPIRDEIWGVKEPAASEKSLNETKSVDVEEWTVTTEGKQIELGCGKFSLFFPSTYWKRLTAIKESHQAECATLRAEIARLRKILEEKDANL